MSIKRFTLLIIATAFLAFANICFSRYSVPDLLLSCVSKSALQSSRYPFITLTFSPRIHSALPRALFIHLYFQLYPTNSSSGITYSSSHLAPMGQRNDYSFQIPAFHDIGLCATGLICGILLFLCKHQQTLSSPFAILSIHPYGLGQHISCFFTVSSTESSLYYNFPMNRSIDCIHFNVATK